MEQKKINMVTIPSSWTWNVIKLDHYYSHRQSKSYKNHEKAYFYVYTKHIDLCTVTSFKKSP